MGEETFWKSLCGHRDNMTAWRHGDFGHCFEHVVIVLPIHVILILVTTFHIARTRRVLFYDSVSLPNHVRLRLFITVCLTILPIVQVTVSYFVNHVKLSAVDILDLCVLTLCWCLQSVYIYRLKYMFWESYRGHVVNIVIYLMLFVSVCFELYSAILNTLQKRHLIESYCMFVTFGGHILYILTLTCRGQRELETGLLHGTINVSPSETMNFAQTYHSYGSIPIQEREITQAERGASCFSRLTFYWVRKLMLKGSKQQIRSADDIFLLPGRLNTVKVNALFDICLKSKETVNSSSSSSDVPQVQIHLPKQNRTLMRALHQAFGVEYYSLGILKLLADGAGFAGPILLNFLVTFIEEKKDPKYYGYIYASCLLIATLIGSFLSTQFDYNVKVVAFKIRTAIITTIYRKSLTVSSVSASDFSSGEIVNFMSTDTDRIINFCPSFHAVWSLPFQIGVSLFLLYQQVGLAFLAGLGFALILIPINRWIANKIGELSTDMMAQKDNRVKMMNEILYGIKVVKFYAWEDHFKTKIEELRHAELKSLKGRKYLDALCVYFWATTPVLISIITFTTYSLLGHELTAAKVFTSLSLFLMLISPLNAFPWVINGLVESWVSLKRVQAFVSVKDLDLDSYYSNDTNIYNPEEVVKVRDGVFSWTESSNENPGTLMLRNLNFIIEEEQFVGIVGKVGSGKSSIFSAILAEMSHVSGYIHVENLDSIALVTQEPWIQHATIRDNILFGQEFDHQKYEAVIDAVALHDDLKILPASDRTEVGENGVTLSGGQKARLSLARALYQDKSVYLLDDPLAAVDAHVAKHLYTKCIMGLLKNKTRILCTHHTKYLSNADVVMEIRDGTVVQIGTPSEVLGTVELQDEEESTKTGNQDVEETEVEDSGLVQEEEQEQGVVRLLVYKSYWFAVGTCLAPLVLIALFLMQASRNINDWWLSYWVTHSHSQDNPVDEVYRGFGSLHGSWKNLTQAEDNLRFYLTVYGCLAAGNSLFTLMRAFLFAYGGICAARIMHIKILDSILKAPISFFQTTPIGRIINRFSSDLYCIDDSLPFILNIFLANIYGIVGTIAVQCYGLPWFAILLVPLGLIYLKLQQYYRHTSRELKRIASVTLSPIYAHFSETITGLVTIRAFRATERFRKENLIRLDINQRAQFAGQAASSWLNFHLQMVGVVMVGGIAFIAVIQHNLDSVSPGLVGLAISYSLSVTNLLCGGVNFFTETEKQMVSIERTQHYIDNIPAEQIEGSLIVSPVWPTAGIICFKNVFMRYREGLQDALHDVTFQTHPGEKIGIVGRTGSGKSSLFLVLFRIVEIQRGSITLDNTNLKNIDLKDIRSRLAIIPQDPFLFSGTVRENLDPTSSHIDSDLNNVLERCHLKAPVDRLGGLEADVGERGRNFSVGQRQLVCLARALLTRAKVLCIDEATASIDFETDQLIQETIKQEFHDSTVLTIAHRIDTILNSDRVLVMSEGSVAEFDQPNILLQKSESLFFKLVHK
ncbi:ATP-binding cassette sub-family C member 10-like isoform X1 [Mytilus californianus]|uniref:ATP-binding cassette sub-family C member 10-like isoform X1 n=3 Tax=Mytilus californianus TaxID=6549 RepID=UPI00224839BA|nr:ATP-binding cassette sub-family C member 10-like isoform X1 [Mytilus californianus]